MDILAKFNLPGYVKGKTFAQASKVIDDKFKDRTDPESLATLQELQGRLQQAQEYVKAEQMKLSSPEGANTMAMGGSLDGTEPDPKPELPKYSDPNDLIKSFKSKKEGMEYKNPYPNRSNRWHLFDNYQKKLKNSALGVGDSGGRPAIPSKAKGSTTDRGTVTFQGKSMTNKQITDILSKRDPVKDNITEVVQAALNNESNNNEFALGGLLGMLGGAGGASATAGAATGAAKSGMLGKLGGGNPVQGAAGMLGGALELGQLAFGDHGVDTSGRTVGPEVSVGGTALGGAAKGAQAGMALGPIGGAIGGVIGGIAGLIGGKKKQKAADTARFNNTAAHNKDMLNRYNLGGLLTDPEPFDFMKANNEAMRLDGGGIRNIPNDPVQSLISKLDLKPKGIDKSIFPKMDTQIVNPTESVFSTPDFGTEKKFNPVELLRYAPTVMNLAQLSRMKDPAPVGLDKINTKYQQQLIDTKSLENMVRNNVASNREAILSSSNGSASAARANLIASQLQGTKALSEAMFKAQQANNQEGRVAQQFDLGVDQFNVGQSNREQNINDQNRGVMESNRSRLLSMIGNDLGAIGREELLKKYPELMGMGYNWRGKKV